MPTPSDNPAALAVGLTGSAERIVSQADTARQMGSGDLDVFATPALAALVEEAAWKSVADALEPGMTTVGSRLELDHLAPTPVGMHVQAETELSTVDGRKLTFTFSVADEAGEVGCGTHVRFIVDAARFQAKADGKQPR